MGLEIRQNPFEYTHENVAFRKIAKKLDLFFRDQDWNGLLLGNPYCEENENLQIDLLLYGPEFCIIFDLKDYEGEIILPKEEGFESEVWRVKGKKLTVKGGASVNPFVQINNQRNQFLDIIKKKIGEKSNTHRDVNFYHLQAGVLFQSDVKIIGDVPGSYNRKFFISNFNKLPETLIDLKSKFKFRLDWVNLIKENFKANLYDFEVFIPGENIEHQEKSRKKEWKSEDHIFKEIFDFIDDKNRSIHILQGAINSGKTTLAHTLKEVLLEQAKVSRIVILTLNQRIATFLKKQHPFLGVRSIYSSIYGGEPIIIERESDGNGAEEIEMIPVSSFETTQEGNSLYIILESNLLSNSYQEFPMFRFGSGHLIDDMFEFLGIPNSNNKLLLIGDPYQITRGAWEEAALNQEFIQNKTNTHLKINNLKPEIDHLDDDHITRQLLRITHKIDDGLFNHLNFTNSESLKIETENNSVPDTLIKWQNEKQDFAFLTFSNRKAEELNKWYKKRILGNENELDPGDRLLLFNTCKIPAESPFDKPYILSNGSFITISKVGEIEVIPITPKGRKEIKLKYRKIEIVPEEFDEPVEVYILENFRNNPMGTLSKDEHLAIKILINQKVKKLRDSSPFEESEEFRVFSDNSKVKSLTKTINDIKSKKNKEKDKLKMLERELASIREMHKKKYNWRLKKKVFYEDPYINSLYVKHGWSFTVDKSLGGKWSKIIIDANQNDKNDADLKRGIDNLHYFKWIYSGLSRADNEAQILNFEPISPFKKCVYDEKLPEAHFSGVRSDIDITSILQDDRFIPSVCFLNEYFFDTSFSESIIRYTHYLSNELKSASWNVNEINLNKDYQVKLSAEKNDMYLRVIFNYGKYQKIKKPARIEHVKNVTKEQVLKEMALVPVNDIEMDYANTLPSDFRGEIYSYWVEKFKEKSIKLISIKEFNYQDRFKVSIDEDWLSFNVTYNKEGFITKIESFKSSNPEMWNSILPILKE